MTTMVATPCPSLAAELLLCGWDRRFHFLSPQPSSAGANAPRCDAQHDVHGPQHAQPMKQSQSTWLMHPLHVHAPNPAGGASCRSTS